MNRLAIPRKNTHVIKLKLSPFEFLNGDKLYFTVKQIPDDDKTDSKAVIKAEFIVGTNIQIEPDGRVFLTLSPKQTDIDAGDYYYDIKLIRGELAQTLVFGELKLLPVVNLEK